MSQSQQTLPTVYIDIEQPGDRGDFVIQVHDPLSQKKICSNKLPEAQSNIHYMYTSKLIERQRDAIMSTMARPGESVDRKIQVRQQQRYNDIMRYGQRLYKDVFGNGRAFQRHLKSSKHLENGMKLVLRLHNTASELWNIPWEYMHDGEQFLSIEAGYPIIRQPQTVKLQTGKLRQATLPLRILVVISDPIDAVPLNIDHEITIIKNAVKDAEAKGRVIVDYVEEGSLYNLEIMLHEDEYHVLHYTGHGGMTAQGSCLVMENAEGRGEPVFINQLLPIIKQHNSMRLVVLSGCQTGMIDETQAMSGIATGLLQAVPAVVSMQFSILDRSAQLFAENFYGSIGRGKSLDDSIHAARMTMYANNKALADWGVPSLYTHEESMRLISENMKQADNKPRPTFDLALLPDPTTFVGRRDEQRAIRRVYPNLNFSMAYVWGLSGMGKSALVRRIIERPGRQGLVQSALVVHAGKMNPAQMVKRIANWLEPEFPQAAAILLDDRLKPDQRIIQAAKLVKRKRLVLVIDQFDALLQETKPLHWDVKHPLVASFFYNLAAAEWSVLTIFTSRYRWSFLADMPENSFVEIHLNVFGMSDIQRVMSQMTYLSKARMQDISSLFGNVGGHPQTIHTTEMLLAKYKKTSILGSDRFLNMLGNNWHNTFMAQVLKYLKPEEHQALLMTCIIGDYFSPNQVQVMVGIQSQEQTELIMAKWEALSLANFLYIDEDEVPWYRIPMIVRTYMLLQLDEKKKQKLHFKATQVIANDWFEVAKRRFIDYGGVEPDPDDKFQTALTELALIMERGSVQLASHYVSLATEWRSHYVAAKRQTEANQIGLAVWEFVAFRFRNLDTAEELLKAVIKSESKISHPYAIARSGIASLRMDVGQWDAAVNDFEATLPLFVKLNDEQNQAHVLSQLATVYFTINKKRKAKGLLNDALKLRERLLDFNGGARDLVSMCRIAIKNSDYKAAIEYTAQAEGLLRRTDTPDIYVYATVLHERGLAFKGEKSYESAYTVWSKAIELYQHVGDGRGVGQVFEDFAEMLRVVKNYEEAAKMILQAIDIAEQMNDQVYLPRKILVLSQIHEDQGNHEEAYIQTERALALAEELKLPELGSLRDSRRRLRRKTGRGLF